MTIGWAGWYRPEVDLRPMVAAWRRIAARFPAVHFAVQGPPLASFASLPEQRVTFLPLAPAATYPRGFVGFDIGCCALADLPHNACKSPMKAWEYAASGAAVVASPTLYRDYLRPDVDALLAGTADEWEAALARLITDEALRRALAANLLAVVGRDWSLARHAGRWAETWAAIREDYVGRRAGGTAGGGGCHA